MSSVERSGSRKGMGCGLRGWQGYGQCEKRLPSSGMSTKASSTKWDMADANLFLFEGD